MNPRVTAVSVAVLLCTCVSADIVLQNPRGSNNRLNEKSSTRTNNNRLFDSQNNNRGGYNVGDATDKAFKDESGQYDMKYFQSDSEGGKSFLHVEWTHQHGCGDIHGEGGGAQKRYCDVIMQYMCQDDKESMVSEYKTCYPARQPWLYSGTVSKTVSGRTCQAWSAQKPHGHGSGNSKDDFVDGEMPSNYCRETINGGSEGYPWCYTTDPKKRWERCDVPYCPTTEVFDSCVPIGAPQLYTGTMNTTASGYTCQDWSSDETHKRYKGSRNPEDFYEGEFPSNYCRLPLGWRGTTVGCYTTDPKKRHEKCAVPYCSKIVEERDLLRNGRSTRSQGFTDIKNEADITKSRKGSDARLDRGLHEKWDWYKQCYLRENNGGLFLADQTLNQNKLGRSAAIHTRQNSNGGRSGYECPEERDYWPYWQISPWTDIAVLTSDTSRCSTYKSTSQNAQQRGKCFQVKNNKDYYSQYIDQASCEAAQGQWVIVSTYVEKAKDKTSSEECTGPVPGTGLSYAWRVPYDAKHGEMKEECLVVPPELDCQQADYSRMNHQGNGKGGQMLSYQWELPYFPSNNNKRCAFRIRYNISTFDYDPFGVDSNNNGDNSPIKNNPNVDVFTDEESGKDLNLQIALNTAQFGRTFQDRSHVFELKPREPAMLGKTIYNLNVRGRRGNIVQTFPSVEYDFTPAALSLTTDDLMHVQWTGSNSNPDDAGQGTARTDRSNLVPVNDPGLNVPVTFGKLNPDPWSGVQVVWTYFNKTDITPGDLYVNMASSGYYRCANADNCPEPEHAEFLLSTKDQMNNELNNAPASYAGVMLRFTKEGNYYFMCTRNNNFTNRSQKGSFSVSQAPGRRGVTNMATDDELNRAARRLLDMLNK